MAPYEYIKSEIITGNFAPGSIFEEANVAKKLNVSRTPVREAVLKLCSEGYLTIIPRKGTLVSNISINDIKEVYEFRIILEGEGIKNIKNVNKSLLIEWKNYFTNLLSDNLKEENDDPLLDLDKKFHLDLINMLNNKLIPNELSLLMDKSRRIRYLSNKKSDERFKESINEHLDIINSLLDNNLEESSQNMVSHLKKSLEGYNF